MKIDLIEKSKNLPKSPGCYLMKSASGDILYVGKAKNLKNRVVSYFNDSSKTPKTQILVSHIRDFDFILTKSDAEAFVLENNLIKKYTPKYNIRLKDDKSYPYVVVNLNEKFPRLKYQRRPKRGDNIEVYGPFVVGSNISEILRIITKSFRLRDCSLREFNQRKRPCLLFQMNQCSAPCTSEISQDDYARELENALFLFRGQVEKTISILETRMTQASELEQFELAAMLRDNIEVVKEFMSKTQQKNAEINLKDKKLAENVDILAWFSDEGEVDVSLYLIRNSLLLGHKNFHFMSRENVEDIDEEVLSFLYQYYSSTFESLPQEIVLSTNASLINNFQKALNLTFENKKAITVKKVNKNFKSLHELTFEHAKQCQQLRKKQKQSHLLALMKLQSLLDLKEIPRVIECYDIAVWQGHSPSASKVVFHEGLPDKKNYKYYNLQTRDEGNNDFAMMREVLTRRLKDGNYPDILLVDGGIQQVNTFLKILSENNLSIPVIGIAKARHLKGSVYSKNTEHSDERLIIANRANPYILKKTPSLLKMLSSLRDEAHRFCRKLHHKNELSKMKKSWLDEIHGIGEKTKEKILKKIDIPIATLRQKSIEELEKYLGVSKKMSLKIFAKLQEMGP